MLTAVGLAVCADTLGINQRPQPHLRHQLGRGAIWLPGLGADGVGGGASGGNIVRVGAVAVLKRRSNESDNVST